MRILVERSMTHEGLDTLAWVSPGLSRQYTEGVATACRNWPHRSQLTC
jgi:hypothetical protein